MGFNDGGLWNEEKLQRLRCSVKNYDWGRIGSDCEVYRLYSANSGVHIDSKKPYAEFWMGTHETGPSYMIKKGKILSNRNHGYVINGKCGELGSETLKSWIQKNPNVLGDRVRKKWGSHLPFLFKVLSVAKPLSIQAHPCKELAMKLHKWYPSIYKDANHKPEMALAVTEFEALCGFVDIEELKLLLHEVPEIKEIVGKEIADQVSNITAQDGNDKVKESLKSLFTQLMSASEPVVATVLSQLTSRLRTKHELTSKEELVLRLEEQYPDDVGVIAAFLMNYVKLNPGEALCLGANELHAYVSGDCIECMATSDNVVRAGLTPKRRDVPTLCEMLTYEQGSPDVLKGEVVDEYTKKYRPPFEEFEVDHCVLPKGKSMTFAAAAGPSLFLVTKGNGRLGTGLGFFMEDINVGDVLFAPAHTKIYLESESWLELYRAGVNGKTL